MFEFLYGFFLLLGWVIKGLGWLYWQLLKGLYFVAKWTVIGIGGGIYLLVDWIVGLFRRKGSSEPTPTGTTKTVTTSQTPPKPKPKTYFEQWFEYYEKQQWVDDVCKYISSDGVPLKIIINFGSVVAYHLGNRQVTYDFFGHGMESFEIPNRLEFRERTSKMYIVGCVINKKLGNVFSVSERIKYTEYGNYGVERGAILTADLQFVELTRPLQRL